jgi:dihydroorotate dehydrogenase
MYQLLKPIVFRLDPEEAHYKTMGLLKFCHGNLLGQWLIRKMFSPHTDSTNIVEVFGLKFKNPIGLAAGFDKNAAYIDELASLGFGFIEIGTVTPLPQDGNPKPRLFRLVADRAIINRMGFNNAGVKAVVENLKQVKNKDIIIGGNIGKNKNTPNENAVHDYTICMEALYDYVHYFVINLSSPNTPGLRELQEKAPLTEIINTLCHLRKQHKIYKPILLKIAPDLTPSQLDDIAEVANNTELDGLIATNTTTTRDIAKHTPKQVVESIGAGGLSGDPILKMSTAVLSHLKGKTNKPIIGVGGISKLEHVKEKMDAGAALVQVYSGFIYEGPGMVKRLLK